MNVPNAFICLDWTLLYCIVYCEIEKLFVTFTVYNLLPGRKHFAEMGCFFSICEEKLIKLNWNKMNSAGINK